MAFGTVEITLNETREKCRFFTADERNSTEIMEPKYLKPFVKNRETTGRYSSVCDWGSWIRSALTEMTEFDL